MVDGKIDILEVKRNEYRNYISCLDYSFKDDLKKVIFQDVKRTVPDSYVFRSEKIQMSMERMLMIYSQ